MRKAQVRVASSIRSIVTGLQSYVQSSFLAGFEVQGQSLRFVSHSRVIPRQVALVPNLHNHISVGWHQDAVFRVDKASPRQEIIRVRPAMEVNAWVQRNTSNSIRYRAHQKPGFWSKNDSVSCRQMGERQCYRGYFAVAIEAALGIQITFILFFRDGSIVS